MNELFDIEKFNLISDEENYYFFRALEPGDIDDIKNGIIKEEKTLYQKWRISEEKRILEEYTGREVKEVPEEYQEFVRQMREYGIINVYKGRRPKEIVQASIGSIKNIELIDKENKVLHELIEKNKNKLKEE